MYALDMKILYLNHFLVLRALVKPSIFTNFIYSQYRGCMVLSSHLCLSIWSFSSPAALQSKYWLISHSPICITQSPQKYYVKRKDWKASPCYFSLSCIPPNIQTIWGIHTKCRKCWFVQHTPHLIHSEIWPNQKIMLPNRNHFKWI
jgi:hypothetical protein